MFFFKKQDGFFRKRALKCIKITHCDSFFLKASQLVLLLKNSQNVQNFGFFFLEKNACFFDKDLWNVSKTVIVKNVSRMSIKWYFCLRILKTFKSWVFFSKKMDFFDKKPWNKPKTLIVTNMSKMRRKWYFCLRVLKTFKICVFSETRWIFPNKTFEMYQDLSLWQYFSGKRLNC